MADQNTWVAYTWPHPNWGNSPGAQGEYERWVRDAIVFQGVNSVAGVFRNDAAPVFRLQIVLGSVAGTLADGGPFRGGGRIRLDVPAIHGGRYDAVGVMAHEFVHSLGFLQHVWTDPLMHPHARPGLDPWRGTFSPAVVAALAGLGYRYTGPAWRLLSVGVARAESVDGVPIGCTCCEPRGPIQ